jgi:condensin complex subunit 3
LSRLQDENDETDPVIDKLINILRTDPSADVRKCVITHILQNEKTVPYLIERARDLDTNIRKWVFLKTMVDVGDFRLLSIKQREHLLKNGISDRDEGVKKSCLKMLSSHWMPTVGDDLLSLLEKLDVMNSDVAEVTLYAFFKLHPQVVSEFVIPENALDDLTSESSFLIKIILKYCNDNKMEEKLFNLLPSPMELASVLEKHHSLSVTCEDEVLKVEYDFIVLQLLEMGSMLDFADEAGRRKVYEMLRYLYSVVDENEDIIFQMAVVMKKLSNNELDFSRTMVEVVSDVCEEFGTNGDFKEQIGRLEVADYEDEEEETLSDEDARTLSILMKCLLLVKSTLQQCQLPLVKNTVLYGLLNDLVSPAVQSSIEVLRHSGLVCLGLYCMLDRDLSYKNFSVFVHSCQSDQDEYREHSLKVNLRKTLPIFLY